MYVCAAWAIGWKERERGVCKEKRKEVADHKSMNEWKGRCARSGVIKV